MINGEVRTAADLVLSATRTLEAAAAEPTAAKRYVAAHLAAMRAAAAVLAVRARPRRGAGERPRGVWVLLGAVAPELGEWSRFFALTAGKRAAAEAGVAAAVSPREADDMVREAATFLDLAIASVGARSAASGTDGRLESVGRAAGKVG